MIITPADIVACRERSSPGADQKKFLRVVQISTTDTKGGAAKAAQRLHGALAGTGVRSSMMVAQRFSTDQTTFEYNAVAPAPAFLGRVVFRLGRRWNCPSFRRRGIYFTPDWAPAGWRLVAQLPACDLINLHWVADLLDYRLLPRLAGRAPVVWTFHDMNVFTGGCHYSGTCERFTEKCGACPQLKTSTGEEDMTRKVWNRKSRILHQIPSGRLTIVCPSRWLSREAARSALCGGLDIRTIPYGINLREYFPMERAEARRLLQLPLDATIVLFVAESLEDARKGFRLLLRAADLVGHASSLLLVTLGRVGTSALTDARFRHLGFLADTARLRAAYSAADVFVIPSLQDNLPNTILEAMACGTPVAGFDAGGISEAVIDGQTGLLAPAGDARALAANLRHLLQNPRLRRTLADRCHTRVAQEYADTIQAARYASLYQEIVQAQPGRDPLLSSRSVAS